LRSCNCFLFSSFFFCGHFVDIPFDIYGFIFNSQGDYYETGTWLSAEERAEMDERERIRRSKAIRRPKSRVVVSYDIAGRKAVQYTDADSDSEGEDQRPDPASTLPGSNIFMLAMLFCLYYI
jgi:hypothetical protein